VNGDGDVIAIAGKMLVDRVIQHFKNAMMQPVLIGIADVHSGPLADGLEALQLIDFRRVVFFFCDRGRLLFIRHINPMKRLFYRAQT